MARRIVDPKLTLDNIYRAIYELAEKKEYITYNKIAAKAKVNRMSLINYMTLFVLYGLVSFEKFGRSKIFRINGTLEEFTRKYEDMVRDLDSKKIFELLSL